MEKVLQAAAASTARRQMRCSVHDSNTTGNGRGDAAGLVMKSTLVGALVLARSGENSQLATRIMDAVRESMKAGIPEK
ncbi:hypothetical protein [Pseudomonas sp.]|uniref:hypothetical protein n=1 Tax=Pseudomonas sp. TaxID=306 RepID=UPI003C66405A